jgi:predicted RNase H-like nuclease (RuvC/YqgF family)
VDAAQVSQYEGQIKKLT